MEVTRKQIEGESRSETKLSPTKEPSTARSTMTWREEYEVYLADKYEGIKATASADTPSAFAASSPQFKDNEVRSEMAAESWQIQYARYCAEKEAQLAKDDAKYNEINRRQYQ
jgi:hypothetical protein